MKKIFTLAAAFMLFTSSFAQYKTGGQQNDNYNNGKDIGYNNGGFKRDNNRDNDNYSYGTKERDYQIAQINRNYDYKISEVRSRWFMSRGRKEDIIRGLNDHRQDEIRMVYAKFSDRRNHYDDHDYKRH